MNTATRLATYSTKTESQTDRKAFVTLRFAGDDLDPAEISAILPIAPTRAHRKGEEFFGGPHAGSLRGRTGIWFLSTDTHVPSDDLGDHLDFIHRLLVPTVADTGRIASLRAVLDRNHSRAHVTCFWRGERREPLPKVSSDFKVVVESLKADIEPDFPVLTDQIKPTTLPSTIEKNHRFEIGRARPGGVYCPPLNLNFPVLYRAVQNISREELDELGLTDEEPVESFVHYTIAENHRFLGSIERTVARGVIDAEAPSIIIRWHPNEELARSYLDALMDVSDPEDSNGELCRTEDGVFTLAQRPTYREWPGPLVIYLAEVPAGRPYPFDTEIWYIAFRPDGSLQRLPDYEVPDSANDSELSQGSQANEITSTPPASATPRG